MPLYIAKSGDLERCYQCLTDWQTTLKDRATQLLTKYKSGALVTQFILMKKIEWEDDLRKGRNFPPSGWNSGTLQLTSPTHRATTGFPVSRSRSNTSIDLIPTPHILLSVALLLRNTPGLLPVIALLGIYISRRISGGEVHWIGHRGSQGNYTAVSWSRVKLEKYIIDTFNPNQTVLDQNELCLL